jgi:hypothetical protein
MENSQTPLDYKEYFNNKFISNFKDFISYLLVVLPDDSSEKNDINKINELLGKLNYDKIITKMAQNIKLIEVLTFLKSLYGNTYFAILGALGKPGNSVKIQSEKGKNLGIFKVLDSIDGQTLKKIKNVKGVVRF